MRQVHLFSWNFTYIHTTCSVGVIYKYQLLHCISMAHCSRCWLLLPPSYCSRSNARIILPICNPARFAIYPPTVRTCNNVAPHTQHITYHTNACILFLAPHSSIMRRDESSSEVQIVCIIVVSLAKSIIDGVTRSNWYLHRSRIKYFHLRKWVLNGRCGGFVLRRLLAEVIDAIQ